MRLPTQRKILREDIKGAPEWADSMIQTLNTFMENVYQCLNKNVTLTDNVASFVQTFTYTTPSTYPAGVDSVEFLNQLRVKAIGVLALQVYDKDVYEAPPGPVYVPWVETNGSIVLGTITGLEASKSYLVRLVVF